MFKNKTIIAIYYVFICFVITLSFESCNDVCSCKKVPCPGYSNGIFDEWFPYNSSQQIIYTDSLASDFDTANILNISLKQPYEANKGCYSGDVGCHSDKNIYSNFFSFIYSGTSDWDGTIVESNYFLTVQNFSAQAKNLKATGFEDINLPSYCYNELILAGKHYLDVQAIWRTDTALIESGVYKIFIQKNTGLLAYQYYPSQKIFVKK